MRTATEHNAARLALRNGWLRWAGSIARTRSIPPIAFLLIIISAGCASKNNAALGALAYSTSRNIEKVDHLEEQLGTIKADLRATVKVGDWWTVPVMAIRDVLINGMLLGCGTWIAIYIGKRWHCRAQCPGRSMGAVDDIPIYDDKFRAIVESLRDQAANPRP